ncbi:hypothetical protein WJX73_007821 [Symbiochloris irregularis]|uniref:Small ribosomal subunit protein bS18c n=1 Tax=Symbiochloris irregularis TaxID=706552 RepID=A0AAW1NXP4_9CHLO
MSRLLHEAPWHSLAGIHIALGRAGCDSSSAVGSAQLLQVATNQQTRSFAKKRDGGAGTGGQDELPTSGKWREWMNRHLDSQRGAQPAVQQAEAEQPQEASADRAEAADEAARREASPLAASAADADPVQEAEALVQAANSQYAASGQEPQEAAPSASAEQLAEAATAHKITPAQAYQRFFAAPPADANESSARVPPATEQSSLGFTDSQPDDLAIQADQSVGSEPATGAPAGPQRRMMIPEPQVGPASILGFAELGGDGDEEEDLKPATSFGFTGRIHPSKQFVVGQTYKPEELSDIKTQQASAESAPAQWQHQMGKPLLHVKRMPDSTVMREATFTNLTLLENFVTKMGKLHPRRRTGLRLKNHNYLQRQIKTARYMGLLPPTSRRDDIYDQIELEMDDEEEELESGGDSDYETDYEDRGPGPQRGGPRFRNARPPGRPPPRQVAGS